MWSPHLDEHVPEMRTVNEALRGGGTLSAWRHPRQPALPVEERLVDIGGRALPMRVVRPAHVRAVYLETHGGSGWSGGAAAMCDLPNADLAAACGVAVVASYH